MEFINPELKLIEVPFGDITLASAEPTFVEGTGGPVSTEEDAF